MIGAKWLASQEAGNRGLLLEAEAEQKELLAPVHGMLGEMQNRLTALLTTSQKQRHAAATKKPAPLGRRSCRARASFLNYWKCTRCVGRSLPRPPLRTFAG